MPFVFREMPLQGPSELAYFGLCLMIGTSQQVAIRRDVVDIAELLHHKVVRAQHPYASMLSGSQREGFRLSDSDRDTMY